MFVWAPRSPCSGLHSVQRCVATAWWDPTTHVTQKQLHVCVGGRKDSPMRLPCHIRAGASAAVSNPISSQVERPFVPVCVVSVVPRTPAVALQQQQAAFPVRKLAATPKFKHRPPGFTPSSLLFAVASLSPSPSMEASDSCKQGVSLVCGPLHQSQHRRCTGFVLLTQM